MDRRSALKKMSMAAGYAVATPTIMNILASCKSDVATWQPLFLSPTQGYMVTHLADIIIPASDTPGALDVNIPEFIDLMLKDVEEEDAQKAFLEGANAFAAKFEATFDKDPTNGTKQEFKELLDIYFKISPEEKEKIFMELGRVPAEVPEKLSEKQSIYNFLTAVRDYTIFGYFTSEKVGEEILAYESIPGQWIACGPLDELSGGKAWSLR